MSGARPTNQASTLDAYLTRVGFAGKPRVDLDTLTRIQRGHMLHVPYENLDVQLGRRTDLAVEPALRKIALQPRGGWCYEMNGVLGWALDHLGFQVTRLAGAVAREQYGDGSIGNHLVLRVDLPDDSPDAGAYLVDVGFGDCPLAPVPLHSHAFRHGFLDLRLSELPGGWYRLHSHSRGAAPSFDFNVDPSYANLLAVTCIRLQTDPASPFVQNLVCMRHAEGRLYQLRGKTLTTLLAGSEERRVLTDADDLLATLRDCFGIDEPAAATLWPRIEARHRELFASA